MYARDTAAIATPIGMVHLASDADRIAWVRISGDSTIKRPSSELLMNAARQIERWFAGESETFDLPLVPAATPRGEVLRRSIVDIAYGSTASYGSLARSAHSSARAIGQACARNPFPLLVPCHRIVNADGGLGAYSAGEGPATKLWLLDYERLHAQRMAS